jgi:GNAT superfamily N-acetyltransferase
MSSSAKVAKKGEVRTRRARPGDAEQLAALSGQLGYPATTEQISKRLRNLVPGSQHAVFVAETSDSGVIGWIHVSVDYLLESDVRAEVNGLIVAEGKRSSGAGAKLLGTAEEWARMRGCQGMNVRSNVIRERAHKFYEGQGYEHYKTQKAFRKAL